MSKYKSLYIFTGKGGVGKTTLSLAFTKYLQKQGLNVFYNSFDEPLPPRIGREINVPQLNISFEESLQKYIARKLKSTVVAKAVLKAPFFNSLFQVLPGISYIAIWGDILYRLENEKDLTIVLDAPSSGHALTFFDSPKTFKDIFKEGILADDIWKMDSLARQEEFLKITVVCLPGEMPLQEGRDLERELKKSYRENVDIVVNNCLGLTSELRQRERDELPLFLRTKITDEETLIRKFEVEKIFAHIASNDIVEVVNRLTPEAEILL